MTRRRKIREKFQNNLRYFGPPRPPGGGTPIALPEGVTAERITPRQAAQELAAAAADKFGRAPDMSLIVRDSRGNFWRLTVGSGEDGGNNPISSEDHWINSSLASLAQSNVETSATTTGRAQATAPLWVRIPEGEPGRQVLQTVARLISPTGQLSQDGMRALFNSPAFQALFQGGQLTQGATQMFTTQQLVGILLPPSVLLANPEAAKALLVAQGLPPGLINNIPDRAISGALQALLQTGSHAGENPLHFLQTVASALTLAGTPVQDVQDLLLNLLQAARAGGIGKDVSPEALQQLTAKMMAANNPQMLGLNQMVQENFGQGLTQIFNAFIRVFMGGAMMQGQQHWPQAVPNEKMLAELGGLFGAFSGKDVTKKSDERRNRKSGRKEIKIDDPAFQRVERKDDLGDEPREQEEEIPIESIFINVDES